MDHINIGKRLLLIRTLAGKTILEVKNETGISTYDRMETGKISPTISRLEAICECLNFPLKKLLEATLVIEYKEE